MPHELEANFEEIFLLPPAVEDWIAQDSPARFIREFVAGLKESEFTLRRPKEAVPEGRPSYSVRLLLRVWLYGYLRRIRSTRKLEAACREQVEFIWLSGNLQPDHNTLWRFWQSHRATVRQLYKRTVKVACELQLVGLVLQAIDGTKIQAACSARRGWDQAALVKVLAKLEEQITQQEQAVAAAGEGSEPGPQLPPELTSAQVLREKVAAALRVVAAGETRFCSPHELEARRMPCDGRKPFGYNAQAVVDDQEQIIVAAEVVAAETDTEQLLPMLRRAEENTGAKAAQNLADGGYCTGPQITAAQEAGYEVLSPVPGEPKTPEEKPYQASRFTYDATTNEMICPQGQRLAWRRERPRPSGLSQEYRGAGATCRACPAFGTCTRDRHGRTVERWPWAEILGAHRTKMAQPAAQATYPLRSQIVEPVFGWIKAAWSFRRWTFRGLEKVRAQWQMICAVSNLRVLCRAWQAGTWTPTPTKA
jgi:transposase